MNRTLIDIISFIITLKEANPFLQLLNTTSKTSIWRQIIEVVAFVIWTFQEACNLHLAEIDTKIKEQKVCSPRWYRNEALRFQYGFALDPESYSGAFLPTYEDGNGNTVTATDEEIQNSKIIKYASVTRNITNTGVKISMKIAGENIDEVLSDDKALAFVKYIEEIQATGDNIVVVNFLPDILLTKYKICIDPLVLLPDGMSILTGEYPVKLAIQNFLKNLPFNGELSVEALEDAIQAVSGVTDLKKLEVSSKWIEPGTGYGLFQPIEISRIPKSGRYKIEDWTGIEYINYTPEQ